MDKDNNVQKIQTAMNILSGLTPRVDQVSTLSQPIAYVVNLLADVRDELQRPASDEPERKE